jgi:hypothetical protein
MRRWLLVIGVSLLVMGTTYLLLHPPHIDPGSHKYKFMHCDRCGIEMAYNSKLAGGHCLTCKVEPGTLVPTERSLNEGGARDPWKLFSVAFSFECVFLLWAVVWLLHHPPKPKEREYLFTICTKCKLKMRYFPASIGHQAMCPRCKRALTLPDPAAA